jgi:hypothetical protein
MRGEVVAFAILTTLAFGTNMLIAAFPVSLVLPVLAVLAYAIMRRDGQGATSNASAFLVRLSNLRVPVTGYVASALIPLVATRTYHALKGANIQLESAAFHILWAGPVSIALLILSTIKVVRPRMKDHSQ